MTEAAGWSAARKVCRVLSLRVVMARYSLRLHSPLLDAPRGSRAAVHLTLLGRAARACYAPAGGCDRIAAATGERAAHARSSTVSQGRAGSVGTPRRSASRRSHSL